MKHISWTTADADTLVELIEATKERSLEAALNTFAAPIPPPSDTLLQAPVYEVGIATLHGYTEWLTVAEDIWQAWTGLRMLNGEEHHGPVTHHNSPTTVYTGPRECRCTTCQGYVAPADRHN